ncbi:hypothetical protein K788_00003820 [Paraburkholderia caribensis MBA4]|uniref:Uncharacterized protein n=1 Tax=Paraburkholderia caribensis MBA4 TaxID=1323664 RepID=A0A0P0RHN7_9BURK|nr:hypothetical protein K788_00003820 [Paraburkholderia caribensis MBA4]
MGEPFIIGDGNQGSDYLIEGDQLHGRNEAIRCFLSLSAAYIT